MSRARSAPKIFRVLLPAKDLERSRRFYETLLGTAGRTVAPGRVYFDCGPVILGLLDFSQQPEQEFPKPAEPIYFSVEQVEQVHVRARRLGCTLNELLHGDPKNPMGEIVVRPWGERSFYAKDPAGNPLCFVEAKSCFRGTPQQVKALRRSGDD